MKANEFTPHAYSCITNSFGIEIEVDAKLESLRYRFSNDMKPSRSVKIHFHPNGDIFFYARKKKYSLNQFMRI